MLIIRTLHDTQGPMESAGHLDYHYGHCFLSPSFRDEKSTFPSQHPWEGESVASKREARSHNESQDNQSIVIKLHL